MAIDLEFRDPRQAQSTCILGLSDPSELRRRLGQIQEEYLEELDNPMGVTLRNDAGDFLHVGLGGERWVVAFTKMRGEEEPENQFWAVGDPHAEGWSAVYFDQYTPVRETEWLPVDKAWQVIQHWLQTGDRSDAVDWRME